MRLSDAVKDHVDHAFSAQIEGPPRPRALRCSALPYCPVLDVIIPREPEFMDIEGALYTSMGTAAHTAIQTYMSLGKPGRRIFGSWKCRVCGKEWKPSFRPVQTCCDQVLEYGELDFRVGAMTGHLDQLAKYRPGWHGYEYKTIGAEPDKPKRQHMLQIGTYDVMLDINYKINLAGYSVLYIGRERLKRTVFGPFDAKRTRPRLRDWMFRSIAGFKFATRVLKNPTNDNIRELVRHRPCKSAEDHADYMARRYEFSIKPCPMLPMCSRGDGACARAVRDVLHAGGAL